MMAKMFYTMDEAKAALGRTEEEVKSLAREGRLREFRDGPRLMFKADQVDALKSEMLGGDDSGAPIDLGPSDSGMAIGLADSKGPQLGGGSGMSGSGMGLSLADSEGGQSSGAGMSLKEDTALAADLGLSGSVGGMPSPGRSSAPTGSGLGGSGGSSGSRGGIDVFAADEVENVDPMAQTAISSSSGSGEQMSLDGIGSGSGLLDLTRESDDTSLGAELLDEIAPSGSGMMSRPSRNAGDTAAGTGSMAGIVSPGSRGGSGGGGFTRPAGVVPVQVEVADPMGLAFGLAALAAVAVVLFGLFAIISGVLEVQPPLLQAVEHTSFLILAGGGLALAFLLFIGGLIAGKSGAR